MDTEHTPLPWTKCDEQILAADGEMIAVCYEMEDGTDDRVNAALIVHSVNLLPELVEALREARVYVHLAVEDDGGIDNCEIGDRLALERIDALLAKATS